jgi:hypothetical protein
MSERERSKRTRILICKTHIPRLLMTPALLQDDANLTSFIRQCQKKLLKHGRKWPLLF